LLSLFHSFQAFVNAYRNKVKANLESRIEMDERDAVRRNAGKTVANSVPGLMEPTFSVRAGRKPDAHPDAGPQGVILRPVHQHKSWRVAGQSPAMLGAPQPSRWDQESIERLLAFFRLLDEWERESYAKKTV
jgi:hypothetical protein